MTRYKNVNGVHMECTAEEEAAIIAREDAYAAQSDRSSSTSVSATSGVTNISYNMNVDVVTIDSTTATATLHAALVSNTAAQAGLDKLADTADDATDAAAAADAYATRGVSTKNELDLIVAEE